VVVERLFGGRRGGGEVKHGSWRGKFPVLFGKNLF
jgi:hypothetical protein